MQKRGGRGHRGREARESAVFRCPGIYMYMRLRHYISKLVKLLFVCTVCCLCVFNMFVCFFLSFLPFLLFLMLMLVIFHLFPSQHSIQCRHLLLKPVLVCPHSVAHAKLMSLCLLSSKQSQWPSTWRTCRTMSSVPPKHTQSC